MEPHELIRELVREVAPNATVAGIDEAQDASSVRITGTRGVTAACELPRAAVTSAAHDAGARTRVVFTLRRGAADVDIRVPDGRE